MKTRDLILWDQLLDKDWKRVRDFTGTLTRMSEIRSHGIVMLLLLLLLIRILF